MNSLLPNARIPSSIRKTPGNCRRPLFATFLFFQSLNGNHLCVNVSLIITDPDGIFSVFLYLKRILLSFFCHKLWTLSLCQIIVPTVHSTHNILLQYFFILIMGFSNTSLLVLHSPYMCFFSFPFSGVIL